MQFAMSDQQPIISSLLKSVDKIIKDGKLDDALDIVNKVIQLDHRNIYARAYGERIQTLREEKNEKSPPSSPQPPQHKEKEEKKTAPPPPVQPPKAVLDLRFSSAIIEAYRTLLIQIWKDGSITPEEKQRLESMRESFGISVNDHLYLEQDARLVTFLNTLKHEWVGGNKDIASLKVRFRITKEEEAFLEPKITRLLDSLKANASILVLDDDKNYLQLMKTILESYGYYGFTTTSGEEGLILLDTMIPDLVLCDIAFGKSHMNGFMFYEKFRSRDKFAFIPFVFVTGLQLDSLIKSAKKIGADDFLVKPVEDEILLSTIEGKIRRYRELKRLTV